MFKSIKFLAEWYDIETEDFRVDMSVFKLGPGPCGKTAVRLDFAITEGCAHITQTCDDGSKKFFTYPLNQIMGRIEVEEMDPVHYSGNVVAFPKG